MCISDMIEVKNLEEKNIIEIMKKIFRDKKSDVFAEKNGIYTFVFKDDIKEINTEIKIIISIKSTIVELKIQTLNENITKIDLEHYYYSTIRKLISDNIISEKKEKYTIRVYYKILHDKGIKGEYIVSFLGNKIRFKTIFNKTIPGTISEIIIGVDCALEAISLEHARSKAINLTKEFVAYLSLLLNVGFYDLHSENTYCIVQNDEEFQTELGVKNFFDSELQLIVGNNMNRMWHIKDIEEEKKIPQSFFSLYGFDKEGGFTSGYIKNSFEKYNYNMQKMFKDFKIEKNKNGNDHAENIDYSTIYSGELVRVPRQIRNYYKGIKELSSSKEKYFRNCCRLYNLSLTAGQYEPTLMLAYMVNAVECLAKSEEKNRSFSEFMKKYLDKEYDKELSDFLYGNLRSGHFHSGEMFFTEYNIKLDISLEKGFILMQDRFNKGRNILRKALINWVEKNILDNK